MRHAAVYYKDRRGLDAEMTPPGDSRYQLTAPGDCKHADSSSRKGSKPRGHAEPITPVPVYSPSLITTCVTTIKKKTIIVSSTNQTAIVGQGTFVMCLAVMHRMYLTEATEETKHRNKGVLA